MTERFDNYYKWLVERYEREESLILNEGLITSYPIEALLKKLKQRYKSVEYDNYKGTVSVYNIPLKQEKYIRDLLNIYGYSISESSITDNFLNVFIEPKFPAEIPFSILHDKIKYCYHITTNKHIDKIKKIGLIPKQSVREYYNYSQNRIYFLISDYIENDAPLLKRMLMVDNKRKTDGVNIEKYYLLRINFNNLQENMIFYRDPRLFPNGKFKGLGIFTLSNIPPDKIDFLGEI